MDAEKEYNKMNWLYNSLYGDISTNDIKQLDFIETHAQLLSSYDKDTLSIIDSACGNGILATALALNGYNVTATDISGEFIKFTSEFARKHNTILKANRKSWIELPESYGNQFDIVFCTGNSIVHSIDSTMRKKNLIALFEILRRKGTLVIETRNWDKVILENKRFTVYDKKMYQNKEYISLYHWILNGMEKESKVEILFQEINKDNSVNLYESDLSFTPFTHESLINMLKENKMEITKDTFELDNDWYYVYARLE